MRKMPALNAHLFLSLALLVSQAASAQMALNIGSGPMTRLEETLGLACESLAVTEYAKAIYEKDFAKDVNDRKNELEMVYMSRRNEKNAIRLLVPTPEDKIKLLDKLFVCPDQLLQRAIQDLQPEKLSLIYSNNESANTIGAQFITDSTDLVFGKMSNYAVKTYFEKRDKFLEGVGTCIRLVKEMRAVKQELDDYVFLREPFLERFLRNDPECKDYKENAWKKVLAFAKISEAAHKRFALRYFNLDPKEKLTYEQLDGLFEKSYQEVTSEKK